MNEYKVKFGDISATIYGDDPQERIESFWARGRFYEAGQDELLYLIFEIKEEIEEHGGCIADVGANKGNHAVFFVDVCGFKNVFAYEASPEIFKVLEENVDHRGLLSELFVINQAVMHAIVPYMFYPSSVPKENGGNGMGVALPCRQLDYDRKPISTTLDIEFKSDKLSYVKLDIEGGELAAIRGGYNVISRDKPLISAECHSEQQADNIFAILEPLGYRLLTRVNYQKNTYVWSAW